VSRTILGKGVNFAECLPSSTRQRARQGGSPCQVLCRVLCAALGKVPKPVPMSLLFAECYDPDTRQSTYLPSVTLGKVTSIYLFYLFFIFHPHKQNISHIYITDIITNINSQHKHKTSTVQLQNIMSQIKYSIHPKLKSVSHFY
jgi:hypothetical protein